MATRTRTAGKAGDENQGSSERLKLASADPATANTTNAHSWTWIESNVSRPSIWLLSIWAESSYRKSRLSLRERSHLLLRSAVLSFAQ